VPYDKKKAAVRAADMGVPPLKKGGKKKAAPAKKKGKK